MLWCCFCSHSTAPGCQFWTQRAALRQGSPAPQLPRGSNEASCQRNTRCSCSRHTARCSASLLCRLLEITWVQTQLISEWARPCGDGQQSVQPGGKRKRWNESLLRTSTRQLERRGRRLQPSSLCRAFQQLGHFPSTPIHLADPACLETVTCKWSSFTM